tara:strand:+ start:18717 stop:19550 length:834 start_codon:yes stop_codon:yes gene_type:complete
MAFTVPQFAIPFTVAGTVTITFTDASTTAATVVSATRYNDRRFSSSTDAAAYVATAMSSADSGGAWTASEVAGDFQGKLSLTRGSITDGKTVSLITFSAGLTGKMFGYDSNAPTATANVVTGTWMRQYLWIPHPTALVFQTRTEVFTDDSLVITSSPSGSSTVDQFGRINRAEIEIVDIPAASMLQHYTSQADFAAKIGATTGDLNCNFDSFRQDFIDIGATEMRYSKDRTVPATYTTLKPYDESDWLRDVSPRSPAVTVASIHPYRFDLTIIAIED